MFKAIVFAGCVLLLMLDGGAQSSTYEVVNLVGAGTITGSVKWTGSVPPAATWPVTKDAAICDPQSLKRVNLERLLVGSMGGVANTVVFLKKISRGKAMGTFDFKTVLDQRHCRYEPHILLVPQGSELAMKSSDATLHTIHMEGAASYNLPFPYPNQVISRPMPSAGLVTLKCNGGHVWMNAEIFVIDHPYYTVTDESGKFELSDVPPGEYEIVAWHEGWSVVRQEGVVDVLTQRRVQRPVFSDPRAWEKKVAVSEGGKSVVDFVISER